MSRVSLTGHQHGMTGAREQSHRAGLAHAAISELHRLTEELGICECRRRMLHILPGLIPAIAWFVPHPNPLNLAKIVGFCSLIVCVVVLAICWPRKFLRPGEDHWSESVIGYAVPLLGILILLRGRTEIPAMALGIVAFGDGAAMLGGKILGGRSLPWNPRKTWAGLISFLLAGTVTASFNYWIESSPHLHVSTAITIAAVAAFLAGIAESLPLKSHDNLRVGITAVLAGAGMQLVMTP